MGRLLRLLGNAPLPWYKSPAYKADGVSPTVIVDFVKGKFAIKNVEKTLADFTFSRASGATYVGKGGYLHYQGYNRALYSNDFTNAAWTKTAVTPTIDGNDSYYGLPFNVLTETAANSAHSTAQTFAVASGTRYGFSFTCKPSTRRKVSLRITGATTSFGGDVHVMFDLQTFTVTNLGVAYVNAGLIPLGGGEYQAFVVEDSAAANTATVAIHMLDDANNITYAGDVGKNVFVGSAQWEVLTPNQIYPSDPSRTAGAAASGLRIQRDPATLEQLGFYSEGASTNLALQSPEMKNTTWFVAGGGSLTNGAAVSPDSIDNASRLLDGATSSQQYAGLAGVNFTSGSRYAISIYAKAGTQSVLQILGSAAIFGTTLYANFNLATGTISVTGAGVQSSGMTLEPNGYYRCWISGTMVATGSATVIFALTNNDPNAARGVIYTGTGTGLNLWGPQVELGASPTSLIPTGASSATRALDRLFIPSAGIMTAGAPASIFGKRIVMDYDPSSTRPVAALDDGTFSNTIMPASLGAASYCFVRTGGVSRLASSFGTSPKYTSSKIAVGADSSSIRAAAGGTFSATGSGSLPTINTIAIGNAAGGGFPMNGIVQQVSIWDNLRVSDAELQRITT